MGPLVGSLVALGIIVYFLVDREPTWFIWTLIALFGGSTFAFLDLLMHPKPWLVLSQQGFCYTYLGIGTISWNDLSGAFIKTDRGVDYICLALRHPAEFRSQLSKFHRVFSSASRQTGFGDFTVDTSGIGLDANAVIELVREQIDQAKAQANGKA